MVTGAADTAKSDEIQPVAAGSLLAFRYRLGKRAAMGDTAEIYRAQEDPGIGGASSRDVMVKLVRPALAGPDGGMLALRLADQAENLRHAVHPGVGRLIADGWDEPLGARFLVLEVLAGETLEALLAPTRKLDVERALELTVALCEVLGFLHANGLLHLDLSPGNIVPAGSGAPFPLKLMEVGRYRIGDAPTPPSRVNGSAAYLAPERLRGEPCDVRADVHAIGAVLYRMLGGHPPFRGATVEELLVRRAKGVPPLFAAGVSPADEADRAARKCLADEPAQRFATVDELQAVLNELQARYSGA
jgi:eukaryotic-like serine/threonine-protein kinase